MRIIKEGKLPEPIVIRNECYKCKTVFEFNENEVDCGKVTCPFCMNECYIFPYPQKRVKPDKWIPWINEKWYLPYKPYRYEIIC